MTRDGSRPVPGTVAVPGREFRYLAWTGPEPFATAFDTLLTAGPARLPASGGLLDEAVLVTTPGA